MFSAPLLPNKHAASKLTALIEKCTSTNVFTYSCLKIDTLLFTIYAGRFFKSRRLKRLL